MKTFIRVMVFMLLCSIAFASAATAEETKPIKVYVEEKELKFDVPPLVFHYTTYVEFRSLFKALEYEMSYDAAAKRIHARSADGEITIELTVGSHTIRVNDQQINGSVQPILQEGRILVPLRFVAETTQAEVLWDQASQTIEITPRVVTKAYYASIEAFLRKLEDAESSGNLADVRALLAATADEELIETMTGHLETVRIESAYGLVKLRRGDKTKAILEANKTATKVSGGFYLDNYERLDITLIRENDKAEWRLERAYASGKEYLLDQGQLLEQPVVPEDEKLKIMSILEEENKAWNNRDVDGYFAAVDPDVNSFGSERAESIKDIVRGIFNEANYQIELQDRRIVYYDGDEAYVYLVKMISFPNGTMRLERVQPLVKLEDGTWRLRVRDIGLSEEIHRL